MPPPCERRRRLGQQRRLANARVTAHQERGAAHEAAAGCTVEFADAGDDARRVLDLARQAGQRHGASLARALQRLRAGADAAGRAFLDQRVPLAAGIAFAGPALMDRAAALADELCASSGDQRPLST